MLFTNPLFMVQTYIKVPDSKNYALDLLFKLEKTQNIDEKEYLKMF